MISIQLNLNLEIDQLKIFQMFLTIQQMAVTVTIRTLLESFTSASGSNIISTKIR